jgi:hypothetical protein
VGKKGKPGTLHGDKPKPSNNCLPPNPYGGKEDVMKFKRVLSGGSRKTFGPFLEILTLREASMKQAYLFQVICKSLKTVVVSKIIPILSAMMICLQFTSALCADFTGNWSGTWTSSYSPYDSGSLNANITQTGPSLTGPMNVYGTECGNFLGLTLTGSVSGDVASFSCTAYCYLNGDNSLSYTNGQISGNTMTGSYTLTGTGYYDAGTFSVTRPTDTCAGAIPLTSGVPYSGTTVGAPSNVSTYGCSSWNESGPERFHVITTTVTGNITATLSNHTVDLDVFILSACNASSCLAYDNTSATYSNAPPGTYYVVVDGYNGVSGSYTLTVAGPPVAANPDTVGIFRNGLWALDMNGNGLWNPGVDQVISFGVPGDVAVTGDWNGSGTTKIGIFRNGIWALDFNGNGLWEPGVDQVISFGVPGDVPVTGDWNGSGTTKIGIFRNGIWAVDFNGNGLWNPGVDQVISFGVPGDVPVTGDWNGSGTSKLGIFRSGIWAVDFNGNGLWNPGVDQVISFGIPGDVPVTGDWNGSGTTKLSIFRSGIWAVDFNGNGLWNPGVDQVISFGIPGDVPVTGQW